MQKLLFCLYLIVSGVVSQLDRTVFFEQQRPAQGIPQTQVPDTRAKGISCSIDKKTSTEALKCVCDVHKNQIVSHFKSTVNTRFLTMHGKLGQSG